MRNRNAFYHFSRLFRLSLVWGVLLISLSGTKQAAADIYDDFSDGVIDSCLWTVETNASAGAAVAETNGHLRITNGGRLISTSLFPTSSISGRVRFSDSEYNVFCVSMRTDGGYATHSIPTNGIRVVLSPTANPPFLAKTP